TTFDANAVKVNLDRVKAAATSPFPVLMSAMDSVEVVDPQTVKIHFSSPDSAFAINALADVPGMMVSPAVIASNPSSLAATPVGTGPYKLVSQTGTVVTFTRNDGYWDKAKLKVLPKTLVYETITDTQTRLNAVKSGQADLAQISAPQYADAQS